MKHLGTAIAVAGLFASTAAMATVPQARESVAVSVAAQGLDLGTHEGVQQLRSRVNRAIAQACNPGDRLNADLSPDYQCRREMAGSAEPALAALTRDARPSRVAAY